MKPHSFRSYFGKIREDILIVRYWRGLARLRYLALCVVQSVPILRRHGVHKRLVDYAIIGVRGVASINGIKYYARFTDLFLLHPSFEKEIREILVRQLCNKDVFVDVGAYIGTYALGIASLVSEVIAIEPHPESYDALKRGMKLNRFKNIRALNIGAWSKREKLKLFIGSHEGANSLIFRYTDAFVEVDTYPLDEVLRNIGVKRVDWIKIDVEGAEYEVLVGLKETLCQKPRLIVELWSFNRTKVLDLLSGYNYTLKEVIKGERNSYIIAS